MAPYGLSSMIVPASQHTLFMRGFAGEMDKEDIRDFFTKEGGKCSFDFIKLTEDRRYLFVALRFESKDVAREMMAKYNDAEVLGCRIQITWYKDLRKARQKALDAMRDRRMHERYHRRSFGEENHRKSVSPPSRPKFRQQYKKKGSKSPLNGGETMEVEGSEEGEIASRSPSSQTHTGSVLTDHGNSKSPQNLGRRTPNRDAGSYSRSPSPGGARALSRSNSSSPHPGARRGRPKHRISRRTQSGSLYGNNDVGEEGPASPDGSTSRVRDPPDPSSLSLGAAIRQQHMQNGENKEGDEDLEAYEEEEGELSTNTAPAKNESIAKSIEKESSIRKSKSKSVDRSPHRSWRRSFERSPDREYQRRGESKENRRPSGRGRGGRNLFKASPFRNRRRPSPRFKGPMDEEAREKLIKDRAARNREKYIQQQLGRQYEVYLQREQAEHKKMIEANEQALARAAPPSYRRPTLAAITAGDENEEDNENDGVESEQRPEEVEETRGAGGELEERDDEPEADDDQTADRYHGRHRRSRRHHRSPQLRSPRLRRGGFPFRGGHRGRPRHSSRMGRIHGGPDRFPPSRRHKRYTRRSGRGSGGSRSPSGSRSRSYIDERGGGNHTGSVELEAKSKTNAHGTAASLNVVDVNSTKLGSLFKKNKMVEDYSLNKHQQQAQQPIDPAQFFKNTMIDVNAGKNVLGAGGAQAHYNNPYVGMGGQQTMMNQQQQYHLAPQQQMNNASQNKQQQLDAATIQNIKDSAPPGSDPDKFLASVLGSEQEANSTLMAEAFQHHFQMLASNQTYNSANKPNVPILSNNAAPPNPPTKININLKMFATTFSSNTAGTDSNPQMTTAASNNAASYPLGALGQQQPQESLLKESYSKFLEDINETNTLRAQQQQLQQTAAANQSYGAAPQATITDMMSELAPAEEKRTKRKRNRSSRFDDGIDGAVINGHVEQEGENVDDFDEVEDDWRSMGDVASKKALVKGRKGNRGKRLNEELKARLQDIEGGPGTNKNKQQRKKRLLSEEDEYDEEEDQIDDNELPVNKRRALSRQNSAGGAHTADSSAFKFKTLAVLETFKKQIESAFQQDCSVLFGVSKLLMIDESLKASIKKSADENMKNLANTCLNQMREIFHRVHNETLID